jgi:hypothetical protein
MCREVPRAKVASKVVADIVARMGLGLCALLLAVGLSASGCRHKAGSPAEAYKRFADAVRAGDGRALYDALDQSTRWNWMSLQKFHREAYDIVLSNFPEGPERERETRRYEHAATASSARELFAVDAAPQLWPTLQPLTVGEPAIQMGPGEDHAAAVLASGARAELARGKDGGWGFAGLAKQAEEDKNRAYHDLEAARASAADYERAAARAGK